MKGPRSRLVPRSSAGPTGGRLFVASRAEKSKRFEFDPSKTWRRRRSEEFHVLSAMERRYLLDLLAQIEASESKLIDEFFISARWMVGTGSRRTAKPLSILVERGVLTMSNKGGKLLGIITEDGRQLIHRWFAVKPPDFMKRFPRLYREFGLSGDETIPREDP